MPTRMHSSGPDDPATGPTRPLLGASCPRCGVRYHATSDGRWTPACDCSTPASEWKHGADDQSEWHRAGANDDWQHLSAAEARLRHAREAQASVTVRRVRR